MDTLELELSVAPEEMCRTCLAAVDRAQLKPIFCSEILDGKIVPFPKVVELTTREKFTKNEKLPNNVCVECKAKLRELYMFVEKVRKSSNLLYEIFSVPKPEPAPPVPARKESKTVEVQTEPIDVVVVKSDQSTPPVVLVDSGTQCNLARPASGPIAQASCQTEWPPRKETPAKVQTICLNNFAATFEDVEKVSLISIDKESSASEPVSPEADDGTTNDADEYDMILVAEEPTEEECYALSTIKLEKKCGKKAQRTAVATANQQQPTDELISTSGKRDKKHHCEYCNFSCRSVTFSSHFQIHRQTLELCFESIDYYRCPTCYSIFISQTHFDEHFSEPCQAVLPEKYVEHSDLKRHVLFYLSGLVDMCAPKLKTFKLMVDDGRYRCARCPTHTESFEEMRQHAQSHDADDDQMEDMNQLWEENGCDKVHVCGLCQAQFPDALYIRQHIYFHQCSFFCPYDCNVSFDKFVNLTRHIHRAHLLEPKPYSSAPEATGERENKFPCEVCGRSFPQADILEAHVKRHYRERKYVCTVCKKCFAQKSDLTTHHRIHTDERPYGCDICGKTFRTTSHRRDHMATHEVVNKYECDVCQKLFKAERILAGHKRLHTGAKPFQCTVCDKAFSRKHHLKLHSKVHQKSAQN